MMVGSSLARGASEGGVENAGTDATAATNVYRVRTCVKGTSTLERDGSFSVSAGLGPSFPEAWKPLTTIFAASQPTRLHDASARASSR
jgi:hypothetical protein